MFGIWVIGLTQKVLRLTPLCLYISKSGPGPVASAQLGNVSDLLSQNLSGEAQEPAF
jgi:hypothetical protein